MAVYDMKNRQTDSKLVANVTELYADEDWINDVIAGDQTDFHQYSSKSEMMTSELLKPYLVAFK